MTAPQDPRDGCTCEGGHTADEHTRLVRRVDASFEQDRSRAELALRTTTSETLRRRAVSTTNGHS